MSNQPTPRMLIRVLCISDGAADMIADRIERLERENAELREELREVKRICFEIAEVFGPTEGESTALLLNGGVPAALLAWARAKEAKL